jgi:lipopolysaccharide export system permease protein
MTIIQKYIIREILRYFFIVSAAVVGIFLTVDFFEKIDNFISSGLPAAKAASIFIFKIPLMVAQTLPLSLLISVLVALGVMNKNNEIMALKSCGIGMGHVLKPVMAVGAAWTLILFILVDVIVPITAPTADRIWIEDVKKKQMAATREENIWIKGKGLFIHIKHYQKAGKDPVAQGVSLYYMDDHFQLMRRVDAQKGVFDNGKWRLIEVMEQCRKKDDAGFTTKIYPEQVASLDLTPEDLQVVMKESEEMSWSELSEFIRKMEDEGYDATRYKVDLQAKIAFPFVCLMMCLSGTAIGVKGRIKEGLPAGIAYGIGVAFLYWMFYSFCLSLGYGGLLPPMISAWTANLVFSCGGLYLFLNSAFERK